MWREVLSIPFEKGGWTFNYNLVTDGVQASVVYWTRDSRNRIEGAHASLDRKERSIDLTERERGLYTDKQIRPLSAATVADTSVIGVDPGRNQLMTTSNGHRLSKRQYYEECGYNTTRKRRLHYESQQDEKVRTLLHDAANQTFKVSTFQDWKANWAARRPLEDILFTFHGAKRLRNHKFYTYTRKQKCLDRFFNRVLNGADPCHTVIAFGNGRFPTSARGERGGPLMALARRLANRIRVVYTDEFRTSKTCSHCFSPP